MKQKLGLQPIWKVFSILSACRFAIRPGCARCKVPEIIHYKGNGGGFTGNKCCSEDNLPTASWRFLLSFCYGFITQKWHGHDIIIMGQCKNSKVGIEFKTVRKLGIRFCDERTLIMRKSLIQPKLIN